MTRAPTSSAAHQSFMYTPHSNTDSRRMRVLLRIFSANNFLHGFDTRGSSDGRLRSYASTMMSCQKTVSAQ